jgi:hypothetical protein
MFKSLPSPFSILIFLCITIFAQMRLEVCFTSTPQGQYPQISPGLSFLSYIVFSLAGAARILSPALTICTSGSANWQRLTCRPVGGTTTAKNLPIALSLTWRPMDGETTAKSLPIALSLTWHPVGGTTTAKSLPTALSLTWRPMGGTTTATSLSIALTHTWRLLNLFLPT